MGGAGATGGDGGTGGSVPPPVSLFVTVVETIPVDSDGLVPEGDPALNAPPLAGVKICESDTVNCVTSNVDGKAVLELPVNQEVAVTMEKDGYVPVIFAYLTDTTFGGDQGHYKPSNENSAVLFTEHLALAYPLQGGTIIVTTFPATTAGVTFDLVDETNEAFYFDAESRRYSFDLDATTGDPMPWNLPLAMGGFAELSPGEYEIEFGGAADGCVGSRLAWPGRTMNSIRLPVKEGFVTFGSIGCNF